MLECYILEEIYRSGDSTIPNNRVVSEPYPCEDCACRNACADCELSCQAIKAYATKNNKSDQWMAFPRIPTHAGFQRMFGE